MGYVQHYLQHTKNTNATTGVVQRSYDLPGLAGDSPAATGNVESYKQEYNLALAEYRRLEKELSEGRFWIFNNANDLRKQLKQWESQMHKMLVKIGSFSEENVREGFNVSQSKHPQ